MMPNDDYGRIVTMTTINDLDTYVVIQDGMVVLTLQFPIGTPQEQVYKSINSMAPS